jgi:hypothetical protein
MGRREDGAAVREGRRFGPSSPGRPSGETRRRLMRRRGLGATHSRFPGDGGAPLPGTRTRCQELADERGWSTFRKRGLHIMRHAAVERREAPLFFGREGTPSQSVPPGGFAGHPSGASQAPASAGAPLPSRERRIGLGKTAYPAPIKEYGRRSVGCLKSESAKRKRARQNPGVMRGLDPRIHDELPR